MSIILNEVVDYLQLSTLNESTNVIKNSHVKFDSSEDVYWLKIYNEGKLVALISKIQQLTDILKGRITDPKYHPKTYKLNGNTIKITDQLF